MKQGIQDLNKTDKSEELIEYLKQDNEYWLKNDIWSLEKLGLKKLRSVNNLKFEKDLPQRLQIELKYAILYSCKNKYQDFYNVINTVNPLTKKISRYINKMQKTVDHLNEIDDTKFLLYLINIENNSEVLAKAYVGKLKVLKKILNELIDDREETEKDIWNCLKIPGVRVAASGTKGYILNFLEYPQNYRECMKKYFRTIITKKSLCQCINIHTSILGFFEIFKELGYKEDFIKRLKRQDIEKYIYQLNNKYKEKNPTYRNRFLSYPRIFLEYIQMAGYDEAPEKEVSFLIFQNDMPKREKYQDTLKKVKFIPTPILEQLDNNIMELDKPEVIPIYVLLRETGWRYTDILNLRYDNCLEQIWNEKENGYNYYLCGEITKTGIPQLKIPIKEDVAKIIEKLQQEVKDISNKENNPEKYLFNRYEGRLKGRPLPRNRLIDSMKRLIEKKQIMEENGKLYHFKPHALRHTRAKEYVEQGINISIIQQILGHRSLQMTIHYATVSENVLYEQWKNTEDLNLFKINIETEPIDEEQKEDIIRYEYVRKSLDAVKVPFGICFKPSKLPCKQQINQCLKCGSFCTTTKNLEEYEEEVKKVKEQIKISQELGREIWKEKNEDYLQLLEEMIAKIKTDKIVHKNGNLREEY